MGRSLWYYDKKRGGECMPDMFGGLYVRGIRLAGMPPEGNYIHDLPVVKHLAELGELHFTKPVTFIVGENGMGKSTLIEALAVAMGFNPEGGTINSNFSTRETHSELYRWLTVIKGIKARKDGFFLRAESFYNVASNIDELDRAGGFGLPIIESYGGVSLHKQSHGESFMALVENRFGGNGVYILDEPEAALSPMRLLSLMAHIHALVKRNSQFIISTHSPMLMAFPGAEIYEINGRGIRSVSYRETEHYQVMKEFLNAPERMLKYLLD